MVYLDDKDSLVRKGITQLLEIKDADIRMLSLHQCRHAIDNAIHIGGAFSATIPMVSLFYGGIIDIDIENPTSIQQDQFVLSKGHAVATLASIYSDLGYFDKKILENSRSIESILNGHPGPLLPGVHLATGPMGQGMGVAQGMAIAGQHAQKFDVFALTGDGELQEGPIWEAVMYAGAQKLENLCVMVDNNGGQLDSVARLHYPYHGLGASFESFGWRVIEVDATRYHAVYDSLHSFKYGARDGRPTAIICKSTKGHGGFSDQMNNHKAKIDNAILDQENAQHERVRREREAYFCNFFNALGTEEGLDGIQATIKKHAASMGLELVGGKAIKSVKSNPSKVKTKKAAERDKKIAYDAASLPVLEKGSSHSAHKVIESAMKVFAKDSRVFSVDSDLASTSGLQAGIGFVDKARAHNAGVAEANMMLIGEALGILGSNVWVSTFCPFFDWKVLRRIAVGHQERLEIIQEKGWLSEGHGIDYTMLATAADLETQSNGATHMGNDDILVMNETAQVKIINVSCPQQLLGIMRWIMEGNKGIIYLRILRAPSNVLYDTDFTFEFGKAYTIEPKKTIDAYIVSSGRGVSEALEASKLLARNGLSIEVVDMPSIDSDAIHTMYESGKPVFIAEQNNGFIWTHFRRVLFSTRTTIDTANLYPINLSKNGEIHYIHSGTYNQLAAHFGLDAASLSETISKTLK
ncbi:transketolase C-terminal domain-containing protein [Flagellimonas iocasae]|uniref:Transketolase C-terminal domain-containing protein n=1 Tax=Flagellimonas iocasae TaxID=2055905 RepID=A0ABW4XTU0_9FLAO